MAKGLAAWVRARRFGLRTHGGGVSRTGLGFKFLFQQRKTDGVHPFTF